MADFITPLLVSMCIGSSYYSPACKKAVEATYIQSGWSSELNHFQQGAMNYGESKEKTILGNNTKVVNTLVLTGIAVKNKKVNINLPNFGVCDSFSTEIQPNNYGLKWGWRW